MSYFENMSQGFPKFGESTSQGPRDPESAIRNGEISPLSVLSATTIESEMSRNGFFLIPEGTIVDIRVKVRGDRKIIETIRLPNPVEATIYQSFIDSYQKKVPEVHFIPSSEELRESTRKFRYPETQLLGHEIINRELNGYHFNNKLSKAPSNSEIDLYKAAFEDLKKQRDNNASIAGMVFLLTSIPNFEDTKLKPSDVDFVFLSTYLSRLLDPKFHGM